MEAHSIWVFIHIMLLVYWLGADLGVFLLAQGLKNGSYSFDQRSVMLKYALYIDFTPRLAFAFMFPVGLHMSQSLGLTDVSTPIFVAVWIVAVLWALGVIATPALEGKPAGATLARALLGWQMLLLFVITGLGIYSLITGEPFATAWLSTKIILFGLIFACGVGIDRAFTPMIPAFGALAEHGSTPEIEAQIASAVNGASFWVLSLYGLLVAIAFLGVAKPF